MKKLTIATVAVTALFLAANQAVAGLMGTYDSGSGALSFTYDNSDGNLAGIRLNSSAAGLVSGQATDLDGTITGALSVINDQAPNFIEWGNLVGFTFGADVAAGAVLPTGLSQSDLDSDYELLFRSLSAPTVNIAGILTLADGGGLTPNPAPGALDLGAIVAAGGLIEDAITFTGTGSLTGVDLSNQSIPNLFFANIDGLSVDIGVDMALAQTFAAGTVATADLSVSGDGGPFNYSLTGVIPEPTSLGLAGLALVGLFGARRRS